MKTYKKGRKEIKLFSWYDYLICFVGTFGIIFIGNKYGNTVQLLFLILGVLMCIIVIVNIFMFLIADSKGYKCG